MGCLRRDAAWFGSYQRESFSLDPLRGPLKTGGGIAATPKDYAAFFSFASRASQMSAQS